MTTLTKQETPRRTLTASAKPSEVETLCQAQRHPLPAPVQVRPKPSAIQALSRAQAG